MRRFPKSPLAVGGGLLAVGAVAAVPRITVIPTPSWIASIPVWAVLVVLLAGMVTVALPIVCDYLLQRYRQATWRKVLLKLMDRIQEGHIPKILEHLTEFEIVAQRREVEDNIVRLRLQESPEPKEPAEGSPPAPVVPISGRITGGDRSARRPRRRRRKGPGSARDENAG